MQYRKNLEEVTMEGAKKFSNQRFELALTDSLIYDTVYPRIYAERSKTKLNWNIFSHLSTINLQYNLLYANIFIFIEVHAHYFNFNEWKQSNNENINLFLFQLIGHFKLFKEHIIFG